MTQQSDRVACQYELRTQPQTVTAFLSAVQCSQDNTGLLPAWLVRFPS